MARTVALSRNDGRLPSTMRPLAASPSWRALKESIPGRWSLPRTARTLYSGSMEPSARAWDVSTGNKLGSLRDIKSTSTRWAVSIGMGRTVATGSSDETIRLWNARTRLTVALLRGQNSPVWELAFAPRRRHAGPRRKGRPVKLWPAALKPRMVESLALSRNWRGPASSPRRERFRFANCWRHLAGT